MDSTGIFFLYVIASPQAECQARVNVNATHGTKTRVADVEKWNLLLNPVKP